MLSSAPTPLRSLLGGALLIPPIHSLLLLNSSVFGISGFLHQAFRPHLYPSGAGWEAAASVVGLLAGGALIGLLEGSAEGPGAGRLPPSLLLGSGILVGLGTKLANGCTSGHMLTVPLFFIFGALSASQIYAVPTSKANRALGILSASPQDPLVWDWTIGAAGWRLAALSLAFGAVAWLLSAVSPLSARKPDDKIIKPHRAPLAARSIISFLLSLQFALALHLSSLSSPSKVVDFLLPLTPRFDPSLAFLAVGSLPFSVTLFQLYTKGRLPPSMRSVSGSVRDWKLWVGAAAFGLGWGASGFCPGPAIVNLAADLVKGDTSGVASMSSWLAAVVLGGVLAP